MGENSVLALASNLVDPAPRHDSDVLHIAAQRASRTPSGPYHRPAQSNDLIKIEWTIRGVDDRNQSRVPPADALPRDQDASPRDQEES